VVCQSVSASLTRGKFIVCQEAGIVPLGDAVSSKPALDRAIIPEKSTAWSPQLAQKSSFDNRCHAPISNRQKNKKKKKKKVGGGGPRGGGGFFWGKGRGGFCKVCCRLCDAIGCLNPKVMHNVVWRLASYAQVK